MDTADVQVDAAALACDALVRSFGPTKALAGASMFVRYGEIVGLAGENGAGKSTLLNIMSGAIRPQAGRLSIDGRECELRTPHHANRLGIFRMYQDPNVAPNLTVYENVFLGFEEHFRVGGILRTSKMRSAARQYLQRIGRGDADPDWPIHRLDFAGRQLIQIARALAGADLLRVERPILLLDEPTASLHEVDIQRLFAVLRELRPRSAIVVVSHRLAELLDLSDRIYVMRDGKVIEQCASHGTSEAVLHSWMVGRTRSDKFYREDEQRTPGQQTQLVIKDLTVSGSFSGISFDVREGEVLGVAGVEHSGKEDLGRSIFGAIAISGGEVRVLGVRIHPRSPRQMIRAGIGFIPSDRGEESLAQVLSIVENITLASLWKFTARWVGILRRSLERTAARRQMTLLEIKAETEAVLVGALSGGNQQKVAVGKWLTCDLPILIAENPTQGIDVGAKYELYRIMRSLASAGRSIVLISNDLPELIGLSNRVLVMRDGRLMGIVDAPPEAKPAEAELVGMMV